MYKLNITNEDLKNINIEDINKYIKHIEKLTNIKWKIIPNYENYIISEYGNIINIKYKRILQGSLNKTGYYRIVLYKNNICKDFKIHRLVYSIFVDKDIKSKDKIYFKDENKKNIHYTNLSLEFTLPKNLINPKSILYNNNTITNISKPIKYEDLKKIVDKYRFDNIIDFIKNIQKDTKLKWRIIPDYKNYIISEYGDVINLESKNILKPSLSNGYYIIGLSNNYIRKHFEIHRLVYNAFLDKKIKGFYIHHKDKNKLNNHYNNLQKMTKSKHAKYHCNLESEEYLNRYKEYYNLRYKDHLSTEEIAKKYSVLEATINYGIQQYKIYLSNNEDMDKYNNLNTKERKDFYSNVILKENKRKYLKKAEEIYNKKNKEHLSNKELSKMYNLPEYIIKLMVKDIEIFIKFLNRDFDKFYNLSIKEKRNLQKDIVNIERKKELKEYLRKAEQIYNKKNKEHLTYEELSKIYNIPKSTIVRYIKDIEIYIFLLNRDFDKFYNLSGKEKRNLQKDIVNIERKKELKEYLRKAEQLYNKKNKEHLTYEELSKIYNIPESTIEYYIRNIKLFIFLLNRDFDKFYNLSEKEKRKLQNKITAINRRNNNILDIGKQIEDLKLSGTSNRDIANKLNLSVNRISDIYKKYKKLINDNKIKDELKSIKNDELKSIKNNNK